jgi:8-oxo-dGTP pyrophosphatase MutT (NUDIX family)
MTRRDVLVRQLQLHVTVDEQEEGDRCAMLRFALELADPLSRDEPAAHFTASAFVVDESGAQTCLVQHVKLERLLQPGGHIEPTDISVEAAALREAHEETALDVELHPTAPRPFDVDIHQIPARPGEPAHFHLDVRYLVVGRGDPCDGAAWYPVGDAGDESVSRLAAKALRLGSRPAN